MAKPLILFHDFHARARADKAAVLDAVARVLEAGAYMSGDEVEALEVEFATYLGVSECVAVGSGTCALTLILGAMGARRPDTVITSPNASPVVADAVLQAGPRLDFVDVEPATGLMDLNRLEDRLKDPSLARPLAVVAVHLYGQCMDMEGLASLASKHEFVILEDARQAHGSGRRGREAGSFGFAAAFSFSPEMNLGAIGQAGMVATCDPLLAKAVRQLRDMGLAVGNEGRVEMGDAQMDAVQAAVLRLRLPGLDAVNERRGAVAAVYDSAFRGTGFTEPVEILPHNQPNRHLYAILVPDRDDMRAYLDEQGVCTGVHYPVPLHLHPRFRRLGFSRGDFPRAERFALTTLSLPIRPELTQDQIEHVIDCVRSFGGSMY